MQTFSQLDADKDGAISNAELRAIGGAADLIAKLTDANQDGKLTRAEWIKLS